MDITLKKYLDSLGIKHTEHKHPAVFTVKESFDLNLEMPGVKHTKNLFLKDESKPRKYYLVCMNAHKNLNLKELTSKISAKKKLSFASAQELMDKLRLKPGSVSIFGMIYSKEVILIVDKELWAADKTGFHPNVNTSTLVLEHEDLVKFYNSLKASKQIIELYS